jgi:hypothetical protein
MVISRLLFFLGGRAAIMNGSILIGCVLKAGDNTWTVWTRWTVWTK